MRKLFRFLLNCVKLSLKVWLGNILMAIILLPLEILIVLYILTFVHNFIGF